MPRSLAIAAVVMTALAVTACGAGGPAPVGDGESAPAQSESAELQAAGAAAEESREAHDEADAAQTAEDQAASAQPGDTGQAAADAGGELSAMSLRSDPGEPGLPAHSGASVDDVLRLGAVATWVSGPEELAISLPAADACWPTAGEPVVESPSRLSIAFAPGEVCGALDGARTYTFALPEGIDPLGELQVKVEGLEHSFTLLLPAR